MEYFVIIQGTLDWDSFGKTFEECEQIIEDHIQEEEEEFGDREYFNFDETMICSVQKQYQNS